MAASRMSPAEFTRFSLLALTGSILLGLNVAGLLQPALINQRQMSNSYVPFRYVLLTLLPAGTLFFACSWFLGVQNFAQLTVLCGSSCFPLVYDWLRYRAIGADKRWAVAQSDCIRLILTATALGVTVDSLE